MDAAMQKEEKDTCVLGLCGEIDRAQVPQLRSQVQRLVGAGWRHIDVDLSTVTFLDSSSVGVLLSIFEDVPDGVTVRVVEASPVVRRIFNVLGFSALLPTSSQPTTAAARKARLYLFDPHARSSRS